MIGWFTNHAPGAYVIGSVGIAVGSGILLHLGIEWGRILRERREKREAEVARYRAALDAAKARHPSRRRQGRLLRAVKALPLTPAPRRPADHTPWTVASAASWPIPHAYGLTVPEQRGN
ncbi:hypothetical protein [Verrucosispora sp. TAA-831]|uniref:hypothetical protein n=1 Tax=Verrucosispora sp. TAA-831 TaxID=3422227 RepID=UPI003D6E86D0